MLFRSATSHGAGGEVGAVQWCRCPVMEASGGEAQWQSGGGVLRCFSASLLDRIRVRNVGGVCSGCGKPCTQCPGAHLSFYSAARQGPTNHDWVGRPPIRARIKGPNWSLGQLGGDQPNSNMRCFTIFTLNGFSGPFSEREDFLLVFCLGIYVMGPDTCIFSDFLFIVINNQEIKYVVNIGIF